MASFVGWGIPVFEIRDVEKGTDLLIKTPALGAALAGVLADKPAALMRGHGSVVVGENLPRTVGRSIYLETNAQLQLQALQIAGPGGKVTYIDEAETEASARPQDYVRAWPMWRERALAQLRERPSHRA
jgi:HCOMODA/2-hydroxy-3-carboxy-muconic semialdehyde decarboxylase